MIKKVMQAFMFIMMSTCFFHFGNIRAQMSTDDYPEVTTSITDDTSYHGIRSINSVTKKIRSESWTPEKPSHKIANTISIKASGYGELDFKVTGGTYGPVDVGNWRSGPLLIAAPLQTYSHTAYIDSPAYTTDPNGRVIIFGGGPPPRPILNRGFANEINKGNYQTNVTGDVIRTPRAITTFSAGTTSLQAGVGVAGPNAGFVIGSTRTWKWEKGSDRTLNATELTVDWSVSTTDTESNPDVTGPCGHTYQESEEDEHKMIAGQCGHNYYVCKPGDHDVPDDGGCRHASADPQTGNTVFCDGYGEWLCRHEHHFTYPSGGCSCSGSGSGSSCSQSGNGGGGVGQNTNDYVLPGGNDGTPVANGGCTTPPANGGCTTTPTLVNCYRHGTAGGYERCYTQVSNAYEHQVTCPGCNDEYWTCNSSDVAEHGLRSCTRPRQNGDPCGTTWRRCAYNPYWQNGQLLGTAPGCSTATGHAYFECLGPVSP